ncbi:MAG: hypothetical protein AAGF12_32745 [Myxococcota bacterium]
MGAGSLYILLYVACGALVIGLMILGGILWFMGSRKPDRSRSKAVGKQNE